MGEYSKLQLQELKRQLKTFPAILSRAPLTRAREREREEINFLVAACAGVNRRT